MITSAAAIRKRWGRRFALQFSAWYDAHRNARCNVRRAAYFLMCTISLNCARTAPTPAATSMTQTSQAQDGTLPSSWYAGGPDGTNRAEFQIHAYNDDFYILRQAAYTNYEKPFLYLLFGNDRAILFDTGAGSVNVAAAVDGVIRQWLTKRKRTSIPLVVAHTHGHGDHVAGDAQFAGRADVMRRGSTAMFGVQRWIGRRALQCWGQGSVA